MKRLTTLIAPILASVLLFMAFPMTATAHTPVNNFKITSGIDTNKTTEITFDSNKIISGTAEAGAQVSINIYEPVVANGQTTNKLIRNYNIIVGSTGIFSQNINLRHGVNYIVVVATKDARQSEVRTTIVRKKIELKTTLAQSIVVPGRSNW